MTPLRKIRLAYKRTSQCFLVVRGTWRIRHGESGTWLNSLVRLHPFSPKVWVNVDYGNLVFIRLSHVFASVQMLLLWTFAVLLGAVAGKKRCVWRQERSSQGCHSRVQAMTRMSQVGSMESDHRHLGYVVRENSRSLVKRITSTQINQMSINV